MVAEFQYFTTDLRTGIPLTDLPLSGVSFGTRLKTVGDLRGTVPLRSLNKNRKLTSEQTYQERVRELIAGTVPTRTALWVEFNRELVWGGIIFARNYDSAAGQWDLSCREFMSFYEDKFFHRDTGDLLARMPFVQVDQLVIARALISHVSAKTGGDIGMILGSETSGVLRDRTYRVTKYKPILQAVDELSNVINGFDYAVDVFYDAARVPQKRLTLSYPRRGLKRGPDTPLMFEFPGNVLQYTYPEDGSDMATRSHAQGEGSGRDMKRSFKTSNLIGAGWPLYEQMRSYTDVKKQSTLDDHAQADLDAADQPTTLPKLTVPIDADYPLGSFIVGDHARVRIDDIRFPDGFDQRQRIVGYAVNPDQRTMEIEMGRVDPLL